MGTDHVTVRWTEGRQFVGWDEFGHGIVMDALEQYGGESTGTTPVRIVLYGLAACTGMDVMSILEKKRQDVRGLEIHVTADRREDEYPKIYTRINLHYVATGFDVDPAALARAIELSEEKYCSVSGMFTDEIVVETSHEVRASRQAGVALFEDEGENE